VEFFVTNAAGTNLGTGPVPPGEYEVWVKGPDQPVAVGTKKITVSAGEEVKMRCHGPMSNCNRIH
jgi:hypothetical protein